MSTITVRDAKIEDAARILEIYAYYVEYTVISFEWDVPSLEEFENRMRDIRKKYPYLVIEQDGKIEGYAYAHAFVGRAAYDWSSELTIYLDPNARKGGLGRRLYEELADRLKKMGILNLYARIGAGSVVLRNLPANCTAVGVPAEVVRINNKAVNPADDLDQQDLPDIVSQRLTDLDRRLSQLEKAAQGDIPPTAAQIAARQRK